MKRKVDTVLTASLLALSLETFASQPDIRVTNYNGAKCSSLYIPAKSEIDYLLK